MKTETLKYWTKLNSREVHEYYSPVNVKNNFHWNKLQRPVLTVFHFSFFFKNDIKLYHSCQLQFMY